MLFKIFWLFTTAQSVWQKFEGSFLLLQMGQSPNDIIQMFQKTLNDNPHHNTKCEPTIMVFDNTKNKWFYVNYFGSLLVLRTGVITKNYWLSTKAEWKDNEQCPHHNTNVNQQWFLQHQERAILSTSPSNLKKVKNVKNLLKFISNSLLLGGYNSYYTLLWMYLWCFFKCSIHFRGGTLLRKLIQHCELLKFCGHVGPFLFLRLLYEPTYFLCWMFEV